jgi:hypothetical protein
MHAQQFIIKGTCCVPMFSVISTVSRYEVWIACVSIVVYTSGDQNTPTSRLLVVQHGRKYNQLTYHDYNSMKEDY